MVWANRACQALSETTRTASRSAGSAPAKASITYRLGAAERCSRSRAPRASWLDSSMGWLIAPHQMRSSLWGSRTTNLSFGDRPVWTPVDTTSGPPSASVPSPAASACS